MISIVFPVNLKASYKLEVKTIEISSETNYLECSAQLRTLFNIPVDQKLVLHYLDGDDRVNLNCDEDMQSAMEMIETDTLRIIVQTETILIPPQNNGKIILPSISTRNAKNILKSCMEPKHIMKHVSFVETVENKEKCTAVSSPTLPVSAESVLLLMSDRTRDSLMDFNNDYDSECEMQCPPCSPLDEVFSTFVSSCTFEENEPLLFNFDNLDESSDEDTESVSSESTMIVHDIEAKSFIFNSLQKLASHSASVPTKMVRDGSTETNEIVWRKDVSCQTNTHNLSVGTSTFEIPEIFITDIFGVQTSANSVSTGTSMCPVILVTDEFGMEHDAAVHQKQLFTLREMEEWVNSADDEFEDQDYADDCETLIFDDNETLFEDDIGRVNYAADVFPDRLKVPRATIPLLPMSTTSLTLSMKMPVSAENDWESAIMNCLDMEEELKLNEIIEGEYDVIDETEFSAV